MLRLSRGHRSATLKQSLANQRSTISARQVAKREQNQNVGIKSKFRALMARCTIGCYEALLFILIRGLH